MTLHLRPLKNSHDSSLKHLRTETHNKLREEVGREREYEDTEPRRRPWWNEKD